MRHLAPRLDDQHLLGLQDCPHELVQLGLHLSGRYTVLAGHRSLTWHWDVPSLLLRGRTGGRRHHWGSRCRGATATVAGAPKPTKPI